MLASGRTRQRATPSRPACTRRTRGRSSPVRPRRAVSGCREASVWTRGSREGDEVGLSVRPADREARRPRARPRSRARSARRRARGDARSRGVHQPPFLRWLVAHPVVRAGEATTAFLAEHAPLAPPPLVRAPAPWRTSWRLNLASPPPAPPPDVDAGAHRHGPAEQGERRDRSDAGDGHPGRGRAGTRWKPEAARRPRGDEDGDPRPLALQRDGLVGARRGGRSRRRRRAPRRAGQLARSYEVGAGGGGCDSATR